MGFNKGNTYILALLTLAFIIGEISHFLIGPLSKDISRELDYGDSACFAHQNESLRNGMKNADCDNFEDQNSCEAFLGCEWLRNGQGIEYQILAGPVFVVVFTTSGIIMGYLADKVPRPKLLAVAVMLFSVCGSLMGVATEYWHLVVLRMGIAAGEAACRPAAGSLIAELFDSNTRGVANGIFSWGVYIGYGLTFTYSTALAPADILGYGWRSVFFIGCVPGVVIAVLLFFVGDPRSNKKNASGAAIVGEEDNKPKDYGTKNDDTNSQKSGSSNNKKERRRSMVKRTEKSYFKTLFFALIQPAMVLLFVAAAIRHTGGYTWAYNAPNYFNEEFPDYSYGYWLTACSIVGGSFGVFFGGFLSDIAVKRFGLHARLWILAASTIIAAPFGAGVISVGVPGAFGFLMAYYFFAETWFAVLFTVLVEIVPIEVRSVCIGIFLFLMNNVGGNLPTIIAPLNDKYGLRNALYMIWPGFVAASGILFFVSSLPLRNEARRAAKKAASADK